LDKQAGKAYFFALIATAFMAANSSLIFGFYLKKSIIPKAKKQCAVCQGRRVMGSGYLASAFIHNVIIGQLSASWRIGNGS